MLDIMHRGAGAIAMRVLGADNAQTRRIVYYWASEVSADQRPFPIRKDGRTLYAWESDITGAAQRRATANEASLST